VAGHIFHGRADNRFFVIGRDVDDETHRLFLMDKELRVEALPLTLFLDSLDTRLYEVVLALAQLFFALRFPIREVFPIDLVPHEQQPEIGDHRYASEPNCESYEAEYHSGYERPMP
jgi:hypothetical protein